MLSVNIVVSNNLLTLIIISVYAVGMDKKDTKITAPEQSDGPRKRIIEAASALIAKGGRDAATTRAVATSAGVQAPTIYRLFGDKHGLLDAAAEHGLACYIETKAKRTPDPDPVQELRDGWDTHVEFGLEHPWLHAIMNSDVHRRKSSPAVAAGLEILRYKIREVAKVGRLQVSVARAVSLIESACLGTVMTLLSDVEEKRDAGLSEASRDAVIAAITGEADVGIEPGVLNAANALRASLDEAPCLSDGERHLLRELLDRIADDN